MSDGCEIAIRSYQRAKLLCDKTLAYLRRCEVSMERVTVFVANEQQERQYRETLPASVSQYVQTGVGAREAFNGVLDYYEPGTDVVMLDDDLDAVVRKTGQQSTSVATIDDVAREGFRLSDRVGTSVWGVYPTHNPYFMRHAVDTGLRKLCFACVGVRVSDKVPRISLPEMHEQEWAIRCWEQYGCVVRMAYYAPKTQAFGYDGGAQSHDRESMRRRSRERLRDRWPALVSYDVHEASGMPDVSLRQMPPREPKMTD